MPQKHFQFTVPSRHKASVEINDTGLYVRFQPGVRAANTVLRSEWPHVAVDLAPDGSVVGIECVPVPNQFTLGAIANQAGVMLPASIRAKDLEISAPGRAASPAVAVS
ncbi:MAG: hypothetical protein FJ399_20145 [Verrucomicrobia bacterium]|nr:hypothetical protein [Verrucomicrobiota bacterium]